MLVSSLVSSQGAPCRRAAVPFVCKSEAAELSEGRFRGYASVFDVRDSQNDILMKGAFRRAFAREARPVALLWQHQPETPVGVVELLREDDHGLFMQARLTRESRAGAEAWALLKAGALSGLSIGYVAVDSEYDAARGARVLKEVELWEISLVTFPANPAATVTAIKSAVPAEPEPPLSDEELADVAATLRRMTVQLRSAATR